MALGVLLERTMQLIVALHWHAHRTGEVTPEMEAEMRETLAGLYEAQQKADLDANPGDDTERTRKDAAARAVTAGT